MGGAWRSPGGLAFDGPIRDEVAPTDDVAGRRDREAELHVGRGERHGIRVKPFDYERRALCASAAIQWAIIGELRRRGIRYYDLEGADRKTNPGVFEFKINQSLLVDPPLLVQGLHQRLALAGIFLPALHRFGKAVPFLLAA